MTVFRMLLGVTCLCACAGSYTNKASAAEPVPAPRTTDPDPSNVAGPVAEPLASNAPTLRWNPAWRGVDADDYILTASATAVAFGGFAIPVGDGRWVDSNSFDTEVRAALRAKSIAGQDTADDVSDLLLSFSVNQLMVDALLVAWWQRRSPDIAWRMLVINTETLAIVGAITNLAKGITARQRPFGLLCQPGDGNPRCQRSGRYRSFFSGHTSVSFTAASLNCMHHVNLRLYGHPAADAASCALGYGMASTIGVLRMVADKHWMSDIITGAGVGTLGGLLIPYALHYRSTEESSDKVNSVTVRLLPTPGGAMVMGRF